MRHNHFWTAVMAVGLFAGVFAQDAIFDGKCPVCVKKGYRTQVNVGASSTTLLAGMPYFDENGKFVYNDPNTTTTDYNCSSGHTFKVTSCQGGNITTVTSDKDAPGMFFGGLFVAEWASVTNGINVTNCLASDNWTIQGEAQMEDEIMSWDTSRVTFFPGQSNEVSFIGTGGVFTVEYTCTPDEAALAVLDAIERAGQTLGFVTIRRHEAQLISDKLHLIDSKLGDIEGEYRKLLKGLE